jgi:hypothetical protein
MLYRDFSSYSEFSLYSELSFSVTSVMYECKRRCVSEVLCCVQ